MENLVWYVVDILLIVALLALAWSTLTHKNLRSAIIFFMAFGLLLALVWFRLAAPDLALAEAAIGAGLSGALFLTSLNKKSLTTHSSSNESGQESSHVLDNSSDNSLGHNAMANFNLNNHNKWLQTTLLNSLFLALTLIFSFAFYLALVESDPERLAATVFMHLQDTGVSNPVTGVLLDFRAYDTMLELAVMLAAIVGIMALGPVKIHYSIAGTMLSSLGRWLVPLLILFSGYILWAGAHSPGGAFQAGALLAAAGVLLHLSGHQGAGLPSVLLLRTLAIVGVAGFLIIGLLMMFNDRAFLDYPSAWAGSLILVIESLATLSIATILLIAFQSGKPERWDSKSINQQPENLKEKTYRGDTSC